jgi:RHS repeat-associated protein
MKSRIAILFGQDGASGTVWWIVAIVCDALGRCMKWSISNAGGPATFYIYVRSNTTYGNRFLFSGRGYAATYRSIYYTPSFNFYEYRARAYNPQLGRFMSEDPKLFDAGDYNLFRYCHNDPIDFTDPMGLEFNDPYEGNPTFVEAIPGRYGETAFRGSFTVGVSASERGGFDLRPSKFDVTVTRKDIAITANGMKRTQDAIKATVEHENKHVTDLKRWHDQNQNKDLGHFKTKEEAESQKQAAYKKLTDRFERAQEISQQHRPSRSGNRLRIGSEQPPGAHRMLAP